MAAHTKSLTNEFYNVYYLFVSPSLTFFFFWLVLKFDLVHWVPSSLP